MAGKKQEPTWYVANTTGHINLNGEDKRIERGVTFVRAGNPLLKAGPLFFDPVDAHEAHAERPDVEQATAAPGEQRGA